MENVNFELDMGASIIESLEREVHPDVLLAAQGLLGVQAARRNYWGMSSKGYSTQEGGVIFKDPTTNEEPIPARWRRESAPRIDGQASVEDSRRYI